ncbi:MAG: AMP-binding protein, partial [Ktedonobacteraceae bacterium]|nr:AMP-binding protein [Ktedonobacteraceae bacterium]
MSSIASNLAGLTPKQRALLEKLLKKQGLDISQLPIAPQPRDRTVFPLSFSQQRMWFLHQLAPEDAAYNCSVALRLTGKLSVTALQKTIQDLVGRHEALRTTFVTIDGHPFQVIAPEQDVTLRYLDVSDLPEPEQTARVRSLTTGEVQRPFDLEQGPLLRMLLVWLGQDAYVLQVTMHHIISDGWSLGIMVREMLELYRAYVGGQAVTLAMPPIQYADYAVWQREWLQGERLASQLAYWKDQLATAPALLSLQTDRPRAAVQSNQGAVLAFTLSKELSEALKELARGEGATTFMALLAAFDVLLFRYTGQQDILTGTPIANRNRAETANVIGCFINTLVLRSRLSHEISFRQLLSHVRETTLNAYANQDVPFEQLIEALKVKRNAGYPPLVQVFFVLQDVTMDALALSDMMVAPFQLDKGTAQFDLTLEMAEEAGGLSGHIEYNTGLFDASTIERLVGYWQTLLEGIVKHPDLPLASLPMLPEEEYQRIVYEWNATRRVYSESEQCLHTLIEKQVERTPDAIAVVFEGQRLTYRELDSQADRLAQYLIRAGVGPEVPVGVCMERSVEMVVALLGILKAGGAYVPLDLEYPGERLAYICQQTQVPLILTHTRLRAMLSEL